MMTPTEMKEDMDSLRSHLFQTPTNPYAYISREELEAHFKRIEKKIKKPMPNLAFFRLLNPIVLSLKDIHSRIWLPADQNSYVLSGGHFMPMKVRYLNKRIYVMDDPKKMIPSGSELIAVNGRAIFWTTRSILEATYTDGNIANTRIRLMEESFSNLLPWFAKVDSINTLQVRFYGAKKDTLIQYPGMRKEGKKKKVKTRFTDFHQFSILEEDKVAILKIGSFAKGWENRYRSFLRRSFSQIKKEGIENVIIDIRGNKGGYIIRGPELLGYLAKEDYQYAYTSIVKSSSLFKQRIKYSMVVPNLAIPLFRKRIGRELVSGWETPLGAYDTLRWEASKPKPLNRKFSGDVYLLTDGLSISNSCLVHHSFAHNKMGTVVGNTCGCISTGTFGNSVDFRLPNSGIRGRMSTIRLNSDNDNYEFTLEGLKPDHVVEDKLDDLVNKRDTQLEYVLKLIRGK